MIVAEGHTSRPCKIQLLAYPFTRPSNQQIGRSRTMGGATLVLRMHGDLQRFVDGMAAMQFAYILWDKFIIFQDIERPFFNTPTGEDIFPSLTFTLHSPPPPLSFFFFLFRVEPTMLTMNWQMF